VTEYTATTAVSSAKVTATCADSTASVVCKKGASTITNGGNTSIGAGETVFTFTVTDGNGPTLTKTYTVTVTKT